uniref:uncharacterized protein LOC120342551 isoform X1 n=1 Tax=Styela clava TaxID=7725 RepID=UPI001939834B|nr:uncharacterized protein LOC120342551 isoform X1 [Styela clava]
MKLYLLLSILLFSGIAVYAQEGGEEEEAVVDEGGEEGAVEGGEEVVEEEQPTQQPAPASSIACVVGATVDGIGNETREECPASDDVCQTKIELRDGLKFVYKECKTALSCRNNRKQNKKECLSEEARNKRVLICVKCCKSDECNSNEDLPAGAFLPVLDDEEET